MDNCLLVFSDKKDAAAGSQGNCCLLVFSEEKDVRPPGPLLHCRHLWYLLACFSGGEKTMKRRARPACLSFLSKKSVGPLGSSLGLLVFSRGEDKLGPPALPGVLACLFYLKSCSPLGGSPLASPIGGAEKTACLSFLSKRAGRAAQGGL